MADAIDAVQAVLWALTGSVEMLVFQTLSAGNIGQPGAPGTGVLACAAGGAARAGATLAAAKAPPVQARPQGVACPAPHGEFIDIARLRPECRGASWGPDRLRPCPRSKVSGRPRRPRVPRSRPCSCGRRRSTTPTATTCWRTRKSWRSPPGRSPTAGSGWRWAWEACSGSASSCRCPEGDAELDGLFVEPDLWRHGIGALLVHDVVVWARAHGAQRVDVVANPNALGFYEKVGFRVLGQVQMQFGPGLRMTLDIDPEVG